MTKAIFDAVRIIKKAALTQDDVDLLNHAINPVPAVPTSELTVKVMTEIFHHEAIIQEMYKDSVGVETWAGGITAASGINVRQYKDNPQPLDICVKATVNLARAKYLPGVLRAFAGHTLTEAQLAAALSFHWNTGAIKTADWVESWLAGKPTQAKLEFMSWRKPPEIIKRRTAERDLFFDGVWSGDGKVTVFGVRKPSYSPNWGSAKRVDISAEIKKALS